MTKVQLPGTVRSSFCEKKIIDRLLPLPCVCQNTPSLPLFAPRFLTSVIDLFTPRY